jgi:hypothetical protein
MPPSSRPLTLALCLTAAFALTALLAPVASADGGKATASQECDPSRPKSPACRQQQRGAEACQTNPSSLACQTACNRAKSTLAEAQAQVNEAKSQLRKAKRTLRRFKTRKARRRVARRKAALTNAKTTLDSAQKAVPTGCPPS